jgi:hypothetical protein
MNYLNIEKGFVEEITDYEISEPKFHRLVIELDGQADPGFEKWPSNGEWLGV